MSSWCSWNGKKWHFWDVPGTLKGLHSVSAALSQSNAKASGADEGKMLHIRNLPQTNKKVLFLDKSKNWVRDAESSDEHTPLGSGISAHEPAEPFILPDLPQRGSELNGEMNPGSQVLLFIIVLQWLCESRWPSEMWLEKSKWTK